LGGSGAQIDAESEPAAREIFSSNVDDAPEPVHAPDSIEHLVTSAGMEACLIAMDERPGRKRRDILEIPAYVSPQRTGNQPPERFFDLSVRTRWPIPA